MCVCMYVCVYVCVCVCVCMYVCVCRSGHAEAVVSAPIMRVETGLIFDSTVQPSWGGILLWVPMSLH